VSGYRASHYVPISIIAHDPKVMGRISSWGWQAGMLPSAQAPVWGMNAFRNRFLGAYGSPPTAPAAPPEPSHPPVGRAQPQLAAPH
jgi:hypothetical protein